MRTLVFILVLLAGELCRAERIAPNASQSSAASDSFVVHTYRGGPTAQEVLNQCVSLRAQFHRAWIADAEPVAWSPRCHVVVHPTRTSYSRVVGPGASRTSGSSLIRLSEKAVVERRIDLLVDPLGQLTSLPHELTHVIVADRFSGRQPPLWADEGLAMLTDSPAKQSLHQRDCLNALRGGRAMRVVDVLGLREFPSPQQVPTFYGQSLSLARFLVERYDASRFLPFVEIAMTEGYDQALRTVYGIQGLPELESVWRNYAVEQPVVRVFANID